MRQKEINEKLKEEIEALKQYIENETSLNDFLCYCLTQMSDKPFIRILRPSILNRKYRSTIQFLYKGALREIQTEYNLSGAEMEAYCDTHFILNDLHGHCYLIDMPKASITNIPISLLCSESFEWTIEGQTLKIAQPSGSGVVYKNAD